MAEINQKEIIKILEFDSKFFERTIAKVCINKLDEWILYYIDDFVKDNKVECVYLSLDLCDQDSILTAIRNGFELVDVRLNFYKNIILNCKKNNCGGNFFVSKVSDENVLSEIKRRGCTLFKLSRYYNDKHFSEDKVNQFHEIWIENIYKSPNGVLLALFNSESKICGFLAGEFFDTYAKIVLIGKFVQTRGIGAHLIKSYENLVIQKKIPKIVVITQAKNIKAVNLYIKCGFRLSHTEVFFHKWYS